MELVLKLFTAVITRALRLLVVVELHWTNRLAQGRLPPNPALEKMLFGC